MVIPLSPLPYIVSMNANMAGSRGKQAQLVVYPNFQLCACPALSVFSKTGYGEGIGNQRENASLHEADSLITSVRL